MIKTIIAMAIGATGMYFYTNPGKTDDLVNMAKKSVNSVANQVADATSPTWDQRVNDIVESAKRSIDQALD